MLQPIGNKICIRPDADQTMIGSIHLPSTASEDVKKRFRGTVLAVGPGKRRQKKDGALLEGREEMPVKVGDVVHWNDRGGFLTDLIQFEGEKVVMLTPDDLMAVEREVNA